MAIGFVMTFDGLEQHAYDAAMAPGALDLATPANRDTTDKWPEGLVSHAAGPTATGWCVVDVWESQASFDAFLRDRLGPVFQQIGIPEPELTAFEIYNSHAA